MGLNVSAWQGLELEQRIAEGNRNEVWRGSLSGRPVSIRRSRRDENSLNWELDLIDHLASSGFTVPTVIESTDAERVKGDETTSYADWMSASRLGSLIQATSGSSGGVGSWCRNRAGFAW
jgi:hypothetical protein